MMGVSGWWGSGWGSRVVVSRGPRWGSRGWSGCRGERVPGGGGGPGCPSGGGLGVVGVKEVTGCSSGRGLGVVGFRVQG